MNQTTKVTTVSFEYVNETDSVQIKHDGEVVWKERTWASIDQYFRFYAPFDLIVIQYRDDA